MAHAWLWHKTGVFTNLGKWWGPYLTIKKLCWHPKHLYLNWRACFCIPESSLLSCPIVGFFFFNYYFYYCVCMLVAQLCATPWTAAHQAPLSMEILQARILEQAAIPFSRGSSRPRDQTRVSCTAGRFLHHQSHQRSPVIIITAIGSSAFFCSSKVWSNQSPNPCSTHSSHFFPTPSHFGLQFHLRDSKGPALGRDHPRHDPGVPLFCQTISLCTYQPTLWVTNVHRACTDLDILFWSPSGHLTLTTNLHQFILQIKNWDLQSKRPITLCYSSSKWHSWFWTTSPATPPLALDPVSCTSLPSPLCIVKLQWGRGKRGILYSLPPGAVSLELHSIFPTLKLNEFMHWSYPYE